MVEDWETSCLDGKYPNQVCYVYDRLVSFQVYWVSIDGLSGAGVVVFSHDKDSKLFQTRW